MENIFQEMLCEYSGEFANFCRMSPCDFNYLLSKVEPIIGKKTTKWRIPIPAKVRLAVTLRFLATGDSYRSLHFLFKISSSVISKIIIEVCQAINTVLKDEIKVFNISLLLLLLLHILFIKLYSTFAFLNKQSKTLFTK